MPVFSLPTYLTRQDVVLSDLDYLHGANKSDPFEASFSLCNRHTPVK